MSDLIERLRGPSPSIPAMRDAADEIERLRERLRIVADECDEHAYWRQKLADDLHDRETQIIELRRQLAECSQMLARQAATIRELTRP